MCCETSLRIANGRMPGDEEGQVTFVSQSQVGSSLIDYVLASADAFPLIQSLTILPAPESDHAALHLIISRTPAAEQPPAPRRRRRRHQQQQQPQQPTTQQPLRLSLISVHLCFSTFCCWVFYVFILVFDLFVHVAPAGAPA